MHKNHQNFDCLLWCLPSHHQFRNDYWLLAMTSCHISHCKQLEAFKYVQTTAQHYPNYNLAHFQCKENKYISYPINYEFIESTDLYMDLRCSSNSMTQFWHDLYGNNHIAYYKHISNLLVEVLGPISQIIIKANYKRIQLTKWWQHVTIVCAKLMKLVILHLLTKTRCNSATSELCNSVLASAHRSSKHARYFGKDDATFC